MNIMVRAGVPQPSGYLVHSAHAAQLPVLFSANAFAQSKDGVFTKFNVKAAANLPDDLDAALDSAGFVAAVRYGDFRWTVREYFQLVETRNWSWYASMDYCCEQPVAASTAVRMMRIEATALGYLKCCKEAAQRALPAPMPVIQGWFPEEYVRCTEMLAITQWPDMVGIGSVCRRNVDGPDGIKSIIEALDLVLPEYVSFHLFGVKGAALKQLGNHRRFKSIDSMAWDFAVRQRCRTGRTQEMRAKAMIGWQKSQAQVVPNEWTEPQEWNSTEPAAVKTTAQLVHEIVAEWFANNLLGEHGYRDSTRMADEQAQFLTLQIEYFGLSSLADSTDEVDVQVYETLSTIY